MRALLLGLLVSTSTVFVWSPLSYGSEPQKLGFRERIEQYLIRNFLYKMIEFQVAPAKKKGWHYQQHEFNNGEKLDLWWWLGNADDPEAPDWYLPGRPEWERKLRWHLRNPLHNFTFYVVGVADRTHEDDYLRFGLYPNRVMAPQEGWNWSVTTVDSLTLPFLSYWQEDFLGSGRKFVFYFGWRDRGNLGAKINFKAPDERSP